VCVEREIVALSLLLEGKRAFVTGGTRGIGAALCEVFAREGADVAFNYHSREDLAATIWREVSAVAGLPAELPPWQIVRERRATFAATPEENAKRPGTATKFSNLYLAGDWTDTGLPATIEGAIRSGNRAADLALR